MVITAYHNEDLIDEDGSRPFGVEIYKGECFEEVDYEFFSTLEECEARIKEINDLQTEDWNEIYKSIEIDIDR